MQSYDIDYELYKYINELADEYVETEDLLERNGFTFDEAFQEALKFKEMFYRLLEKNNIRRQDIAVICDDLVKSLYIQPDNSDLQYLYLCVMTDFGLLIRTDPEGDEEQKVRNYIRQQELIHELTEFIKIQSDNNRKYNELREHLKKSIKTKKTDFSEESDFLYHLTIQHTFLYESVGNRVYRDNLNALLQYINSDEQLMAVKPYVVFAVVSRKTGMMQNRKHFIPNIKAVFQYQSYSIYKDNGKNFNQYQSEIELYDHIRRSYIDDDVDMELCDFCFANLSPLSEWYYQNCEPNEDIPMSLGRKIQTIMPKSFPNILSCSDYEEMNENELSIYGNAANELLEKMLQAADCFLKI